MLEPDLQGDDWVDPNAPCKNCCLPHIAGPPQNVIYMPVPPACKCAPGDLNINCEPPYNLLEESIIPRLQKLANIKKK
jgi:hypothetical protein